MADWTGAVRGAAAGGGSRPPVRWGRLAVKALVSFGLLGLLLVLLPWADLREAVGGLALTVWAGVLAGFLIGHALGTVKWRLMVTVGRAELPFREAARCYAAGLFANLCLPSIVGGDVLRAALAGRATGRPEAAVLGALTDRVSDVVALTLLMAGGLALTGRALGGSAATAAPAVVGLGLALGAVTVAVLARRPLAAWPRRIRRPVGRGLVALRRLVRRPGTALLALCLSLAIQSGFVLLNAWIGRSVGIGVPLAAWFLVWPLAKIAGLLPISLGGLGVRDATLGALLVPLGVSMATGVVASLVWQSVLVVGGLLAGGLWLALGRGSASSARRREEAGPSPGRREPLSRSALAVDGLAADRRAAGGFADDALAADGRGRAT